MHKEKLTVLIVEDNPDAKAAIEFLLHGRHNAEFAGSVEEAIRKYPEKNWDCVILDYNLPDGTGHEILKTIRGQNADQPVIMLSAVHETETIVKSVQLGANDYLTKPVEKEALFRVLRKIERTKQLEWEKTVLLEKVKDAENRFHGVIGQSVAMRHVCETAAKLKSRETSILIMGESGVGKEVIARAIHAQEQDPMRPFVAVNCAAIPENLLESELFGHEKGAFTGANQTRLGKFVQANGGDIFLDEIACMSTTLQAKLLRVLQDKIIEPLGSNRQIHSNFRVIAATNQDIPAMIEKGRFRQDLYFRLQGVEIFIPPLRSRAEDIPLLVEYLLKDLAPKFGVRHFNRDAMEAMMTYGWPGNVRELKNTVENILILTPDEVITPDHLPPTLRDQRLNGARVNLISHLRDNIKTFERDVIITALKRHHGNKSRASKDLGISRSILYRKMKMLKLKDTDIY